ncbi:MAG: UDP-N-acetylglucosamine 2-epimerase [Patescibacteria group bacterium]
MIAFVIGTKAELIKCISLMLELKKAKQSYWFIHTGQHPVEQACEQFKVKKPDYILSEQPKETKFWSKINQKSVWWSMGMIFKVKKIIKKLKPSYVVYHGDTMSSAIAAIATSNFLNKKKSWQNVHLEAGLRSGSNKEPFPEEISRKICDKYSDILLAVSDRSKRNLEGEKRKGKIYNVGNTIVDCALITHKNSKFKKKDFEYALINLHRHENLKSKKRMQKCVQIINMIESKGIWPIHESTKMYLKKYNLRVAKNIQIVPLTSYPEFIHLLANCKYLVVDGGSIQEESLIFKKPCLLLRKRTERPEGLETGINFLTKLNPKYSKQIIEQIEDNELLIKDFQNPYGKLGLTKNILKLFN